MALKGYFAAMFGALEMTVDEAIGFLQVNFEFQTMASSRAEDGTPTTPLFDGDTFEKRLNQLFRTEESYMRKKIEVLPHHNNIPGRT